MQVQQAAQHLAADRGEPVGPAHLLMAVVDQGEALDPRTWEVLRWRQEHLPLHRLKRRSHYDALWSLESRAARRVA